MFALSNQNKNDRANRRWLFSELLTDYDNYEFENRDLTLIQQETLTGRAAGQGGTMTTV